MSDTFSDRNQLVRFQGSFAAAAGDIPIASLAEPLAWEAIAVAWGFGMGSIALSNTWWETTLQRLIPEHVYSRVRSYDILVSFVFMPLGFLVAPLIARWIGFASTLLVAASAAALSSLVTALAPGVQAIRDEPLELG